MTTIDMRSAEQDLLERYKHQWILSGFCDPTLDDRAEMLIEYAHRFNEDEDSLSWADWMFAHEVLVSAVRRHEFAEWFHALREAEREWSDFVDHPPSWIARNTEDGMSFDGAEEQLRTHLDLAVWELLCAVQPCRVCVTTGPRQAWQPVVKGIRCAEHTEAQR